MKIYILTGTIQSGKTTALMNCFGNNPKVGGFLTPVVNGKRVFYSLSKQTSTPMEAAENESDILPVGRFRFSKRAFEQAIHWFETDAHTSEKALLILDEIGPLELKQAGFYSLLKNHLSDERNSNLILVVRDRLVKEVTQLFDLQRFGITILGISEIGELCNQV